ncbi:hypothetical protein [Paracidovorax cattleyae]|uniref:TnsE C-terminal domain-containing protein n=1 Tax=Paracidovorax cattleyae TaxID=80868 RepID=A0A1H0U350_9BURK|nr:hypothetical protein [Paracidovorax cattleyae]SDP60609.1 hypothetical protein SAMN04489708_117101 [Paracidovorax cattleyae]
MSEREEYFPQPIKLLKLDRGPGVRSHIDWLGDIVGDQERRIRVAVSDWNLAKRFGGKSEQRMVELPVAYLSELRVGDLWVEGVREQPEQVTTEAFINLRVDNTTTELFAVGRNLATNPHELAKFAIPFSQFDGYKQHTKSFVVRVKVRERTYLLVPSTEIVRFYFGTSGALLKQIFSGALARRELVAGCNIRSDTGVANVEMPKGFPREAAPIIARIAFDPAATHALNQLIVSGTLACQNNIAWYPKMGFPIAGTTNLHARGWWSEQGEERTFFVQELESCSYPFPYHTLFIHYRNEREDLNGASATSARKINVAARAKSKNPLTLATRPIERGKQLRVETGHYQRMPAFPDLLNKRLLRGAERPSSITAAAASELPEAASLGGVQGAPAPGVEVVVDWERVLAELPPILGCLICKLYMDGWVSVRFDGGHIASYSETDALPTKAISSYGLCLAFLRRPGGGDGPVFGLACLDPPIGGRIPELAVLRLYDGTSANLRDESKEHLRKTMWTKTAGGAARAKIAIEEVFSSEQVTEAVQRERLGDLLQAMTSDDQ